MTTVKGARFATALLTLVGAVGCGDDVRTGAETSASETEALVGTPVTHNWGGEQEEAEISGTLGGSLECLWLEGGDGRTSLFVRPGSSTRQEGEIVVLLDPEGEEVARTGDRVVMAGGHHDDEVSCAHDGARRGRLRRDHPKAADVQPTESESS